LATLLTHAFHGDLNERWHFGQYCNSSAKAEGKARHFFVQSPGSVNLEACLKNPYVSTRITAIVETWIQSLTHTLFAWQSAKPVCVSITNNVEFTKAVIPDTLADRAELVCYAADCQVS